MNQNPTLQVQSVIYGNEPESLYKAISNLANAIRVEREQRRFLGQVTLYYGDASPERVLSEAEVEQIRKKYQDLFRFKYRVFGFNSVSAKGHNMLGEECESDYMLIINPDVIMSPRTLIELMYPFLDEEVGMVEARQTPIEHQKEYDVETLETDWATTACAVFSKALFDELNGFDSETFFLYCDDLDFSWRVRLAGYKIIYQPLAPVFHAKRLSVKASWQPTKAEQYYSAEAALLMAHKWSNPGRVEQLLQVYQNSQNENCEKAAAHFIELRAADKLPEPLDPEHRVAKFIGDYYTENRYIL